DRGAVRDQAEIARLAGVTRARVTQVMDLLFLAPAIQEAILDLPRTARGRDSVVERDLRRVATLIRWDEQLANSCVLSARASRSEVGGRDGSRRASPSLPR